MSKTSTVLSTTWTKRRKILQNLAYPMGVLIFTTTTKKNNNNNRKKKQQ